MAVQDPRHPHHRRAQLDPQGLLFLLKTSRAGVYKTLQIARFLLWHHCRVCVVSSRHPQQIQDRCATGPFWLCGVGYDAEATMLPLRRRCKPAWVPTRRPQIGHRMKCVL